MHANKLTGDCRYLFLIKVFRSAGVTVDYAQNLPDGDIEIVVDDHVFESAEKLHFAPGVLKTDFELLFRLGTSSLQTSAQRRHGRGQNENCYGLRIDFSEPESTLNIHVKQHDPALSNDLLKGTTRRAIAIQMDMAVLGKKTGLGKAVKLLLFDKIVRATVSLAASPLTRSVGD